MSPYIDQLKRDKFIGLVSAMHEPSITSAGELNYLITNLIMAYSQQCPHGYATMNEIMGVLSCILQEYYRRIMVPYENGKREINGDVFYG